VWTNFGYSRAYLERMQSQSFWDGELKAIRKIDRNLMKKRSAY